MLKPPPTLYRSLIGVNIPTVYKPQQRWECLCVYRSLLRAVTYLPDSFAREEVHKQVVSRFRAAKSKYKKKAVTDVSLKKKLKDAAQTARVLEKAGDGDMKDLERVLLAVHGRRGKRRMQLLRHLILAEQTSVPKDDVDLEAIIHGPNLKRSKFEGSKLSALLRTHAEHNPSDNTRPPIRKTKPDTPEENIWGRPTPLKAAAGLEKKWWALTLDKVLPPVPEHEWRRLRDLARGRLSVEDPPLRRARAINIGVIEPDVHSLPITCNNSDLIHTILNRSLLHTAASEPRSIDKRTMRRLYAKIWNQTPMMKWDEQTKTWETIWGGQRTDVLSGMVARAKAEDAELFEGIEDVQIKVSSPRKQRGRK